jgi:hypothetical protein
MLLARERWAEFSMADPTTHALALFCFGVAGRDEVAGRANSGGGTRTPDTRIMIGRRAFRLISARRGFRLG